MRRHAGFTLIELAATVSVMAILAGIAAPSLAGFIESQRASAAITSLVTHMSLARMSAITYRQSAVLCPSLDGVSCLQGTDWSGGWLLFLDTDEDQRRGDGEEI